MSFQFVWIDTRLARDIEAGKIDVNQLSMAGLHPDAKFRACHIDTENKVALLVYDAPEDEMC